MLNPTFDEAIFKALHDKKNLIALIDDDYFSESDRQFRRNSSAYLILWDMDTGEKEEFFSPGELLAKYGHLVD